MCCWCDYELASQVGGSSRVPSGDQFPVVIYIHNIHYLYAYMDISGDQLPIVTYTHNIQYIYIIYIYIYIYNIYIYRETSCLWTLHLHVVTHKFFILFLFIYYFILLLVDLLFLVACEWCKCNIFSFFLFQGGTDIRAFGIVKKKIRVVYIQGFGLKSRRVWSSG